MVIYDLMCDFGHSFEGWFKNSEDWQAQTESGLLTCPVCSSDGVSKKPTASKVARKSNSGNSSGTSAGISPEVQNHPAQELVRADPQSPEKYAKLQRMISQVHDYVDKNFEDVGNKFAETAINMHRGEIDQANIRGVANKEQITKMAEEGIPAVALPPKPVDPKKLN